MNNSFLNVEFKAKSRHFPYRRLLTYIKRNAVYKKAQKVPDFEIDFSFIAIPQKQLPCLQVDGRLIPQSGAIMRYVAREFGICLLI